MGSRKPPRLAYRPPASELPGAQTYVNQTNKENLPPNTDKSPQDNYDSRQKGPSAPENKQQALPITPKHKKKRDQLIKEGMINGDSDLYLQEYTSGVLAYLQFF